MLPAHPIGLGWTGHKVNGGPNSPVSYLGRRSCQTKSCNSSSLWWLAPCGSHSIGWPEAYEWGNLNIRRSEVGSLYMLTSHLYMWQAARRQRTSRPLVQEKYPQTSTSCHAKWHHQVDNQTSTDSCTQGTNGPTGLITHGGKRPDEATFIPWSKGKSIAWDVTIPDTYADSHINMMSSEAGGAAGQAALTKNTKYIDITSTHIFYPIAIETAGSWDVQAL